MKTWDSPECRGYPTVANRNLPPRRMRQRLQRPVAGSIIDRSSRSASGTAKRTASTGPPTVPPAAKLEDSRTHGLIQWLIPITSRRPSLSSRPGVGGGQWSSSPTPHLHLRATHGGCVALYLIAEPWCVEPLYGDGGTPRSAVSHSYQDLSPKPAHLKQGSVA